MIHSVPLTEEQANKTLFPPNCPVYIYDETESPPGIDAQGIVSDITIEVDPCGACSMYFNVNVKCIRRRSKNENEFYSRQEVVKHTQLRYKNGCIVNLKIEGGCGCILKECVVLGSCDSLKGGAGAARGENSSGSYWYCLQEQGGTQKVYHNIPPEDVSYCQHPTIEEEDDFDRADPVKEHSPVAAAATMNLPLLSQHNIDINRIMDRNMDRNMDTNMSMNMSMNMNINAQENNTPNFSVPKCISLPDRTKDEMSTTTMATCTSVLINADNNNTVNTNTVPNANGRQQMDQKQQTFVGVGPEVGPGSLQETSSLANIDPCNGSNSSSSHNKNSKEEQTSSHSMAFSKRIRTRIASQSNHPYHHTLHRNDHTNENINTRKNTTNSNNANTNTNTCTRNTNNVNTNTYSYVDNDNNINMPHLVESTSLDNNNVSSLNEIVLNNQSTRNREISIAGGELGTSSSSLSLACRSTAPAPTAASAPLLLSSPSLRLSGPLKSGRDGEKPKSDKKGTSLDSNNRSQTNRNRNRNTSSSSTNESDTRDYKARIILPLSLNSFELDEYLIGPSNQMYDFIKRITKCTYFRIITEKGSKSFIDIGAKNVTIAENTASFILKILRKKIPNGEQRLKNVTVVVPLGVESTCGSTVRRGLEDGSTHGQDRDRRHSRSTTMRHNDETGYEPRKGSSSSRSRTNAIIQGNNRNINDHLDQLLMSLSRNSLITKHEGETFLSIFTISKVIFDFISSSTNGRVCSKEIGWYLNRIEMNRGIGSVLIDLKRGRRSLKRLVLDMNEIFATHCKSPQEVNDETNNVSYWITVQPGANDSLIVEANNTIFTEREADFLKDHQAKLKRGHRSTSSDYGRSDVHVNPGKNEVKGLQTKGRKRHADSSEMTSNERSKERRSSRNKVEATNIGRTCSLERKLNPEKMRKETNKRKFVHRSSM